MSTTTTPATATNQDVVNSPNMYLGSLHQMIEREFGHPVEMSACKMEQHNCMMIYFQCEEPFLDYSVTIGYDDRPYTLDQHEREFKEFLCDYNE